VLSFKQDGFTLIEMMVVAGIAGVMIAIAVPSIQQWGVNQRASAGIRSIAGALMRARHEAIRTGNNHLVFFQQDTVPNPLVDSEGAPVVVAVINDDQPGSTNQNCKIDTDETIAVVYPEDGLNWGVTHATTRVPTDAGTGAIGTGSSFTKPDASAATWLLFRPDGTPVAFAPDCTTAGIGSGAGAVYITNGTRDYAAVLMPLGAIRVHTWNRNGGQWSN